MAFVDMEKVIDRVPWEVVWLALIARTAKCKQQLEADVIELKLYYDTLYAIAK